MNKILMAALAVSLVATSAPAAFAQYDRDRGGEQSNRDHDQGRGHSEYRQHSEWHKGARIGHDDWNRGRPIDYRQNHLRRPARGYEWREVDGNYVLAAAATGLIVSAIAHSR